MLLWSLNTFSTLFVLSSLFLLCANAELGLSEHSNDKTHLNVTDYEGNSPLNVKESLKKSNEQSKETKSSQPESTSTQGNHAFGITRNITVKEEDQGIFGRAPKLNSAALLRGFYVFAGLGAMVAMYILVRAIRLRRRQTVRKYGILSSREDLEMTLLDDEDDDEEDTTLFDVKKQCAT